MRKVKYLYRQVLEERISGRDRLALAGTLVLLFAMAGAYILGGNNLISLFDSLNPGEGSYEPEIEGEVIEVVVDDERASPNRPKISPEDGIKFVNEASHDLNFTFDREVESFVLEKGDSRVVDVTKIVYYRVNPVEEVEFREIRGGVNVQDD